MRSLVLVSFVVLAQAAFSQEPWMPYDPGQVHASASWDSFRIGNKALSLSSANGKIYLQSWRGSRIYVGNSLSEPSLSGPILEPKLADANPLEAKTGVRLDVPDVRNIAPTNGLRRSSHFSGKEIRWSVIDLKTRERIQTRMVMLDHSAYLRIEVTWSSPTADQPLPNVKFFGWKLSNAQVIGTVQGSPISNGQFFLGLEHPMSKSGITSGIASCWVERKLPLKKGQSVAYSAVIGAEAPGQARRSFATYIEMERARPYQPFLHYNSWYDLGYFNRYNEPECLDRINAFGTELVKKRGVELSSFLFDDGWDNTSTNWQFHDGFPHGFATLKEAAAKYGAAPGVWLSPWGGYGKPREERLTTGKKNGLEIDSQGFALSGPKYYDLFSKVCLKMVTDYGINQFKFDGTGSPDKQYPGSKFDSDFDAAIQLISELRKANPQLFVNLTTGTWPSPFWTRYADSIWRGGSDHDFAGVGPDRQRWITYRDSDVYHEVVVRGPFYPLNSLMLHGLIYARYADKLKDDPTNGFPDEVRDYFGNGTQLQEMYITPSLLSKQNWDDIAQMAKWSQANKNVLKDSHWIGGDPEKLEVYGWASWSPKKSIIVLRNPSDKPQAFAIEPKEMLELPRTSSSHILLTGAFRDENWQTAQIRIDSSKVVLLQPFEVLILEGVQK